MKTRFKRVMSKIIASASALALCSSALPAAAESTAKTVHWQCTTDENRWVDKGEIETTSWDDDTSLYIDVDETTRYQTLTDMPWGGCFSERGWYAMRNLSEDEKEKIIKNLFGKDGLKLTVGRTPLGNNDYSINLSQSYDELPQSEKTDYDMKYFSIDSDREYLLPYIKAAKKVCPKLKLWASPWSPPSWMKNNKTVYGGNNNTIIYNENVLSSYAKYFAKFIQAYKNEGLDVYMVMPQNEPTMNTAYASCVWTGDQLNEFVRDYLAPTLKAEGLDDVDIYLGTFTDSQANRTDPTLTDPVTSKIIKGLGFQWWSSPLAKRVYRQNSDNAYVLMQSETKCGSGDNSWDYAEEQFDCVKEFFEAGVNSYMLWNMVLDEKGENTSPNPWRQNAPIIVNSVTNSVTYTPQYYQFKHFSYYINKGARRIKTDGNYGDKIAFQNSDGENVLVVKNSSDSALSVAINFNGRKIKPTIPPHSINTFTTEGSIDGFDAPDNTYNSISDDKVETIIKLSNLKGGMTLSVDGASFDNGANAIAWSDQGTADQMWTVERSSNGFVRLVNYNSLKGLGVWAASKDVGAYAVQWTLNGSYDQEWKMLPVSQNGNVFYRIVNRNSGLYLAFENGSENSGARLVLEEYSESDSLLWSATVVQGDLQSISPTAFKSISVDDGKISANVLFNESGDYKIYFAFYDVENKLLSIKCEYASMEENESASFSAEYGEGASSVVLYSWKRDTLEPMCEKISLIIT